MNTPPAFQRTIASLHGARGNAWLLHLPALVAELEARWSIRVGPPLPNLSYNYVAPVVTQSGEPLIVKLGVPNPELLSEIDALKAFGGCGCARLLAYDREQGALLLERLTPGTPLTSLWPENDGKATAIAAEVMRSLWRPVPPGHSFPTVARWAAGFRRLRARFDGGTGPLPASLVEMAENLYAELLSSASEPVLLHGDLHHDNILAAGSSKWKAIDPKGIIGEPAYEVGALLRNPFPDLLSAHQPDRILAGRLNRLSTDLDLDHKRLLAWARAQAVLSAWWCLEDNLPCWQGMVACAELLARL
jgi:streptomycin 6-kinase